MTKLTKGVVEATRFDPDGPSWQWVADDEVPGFGIRLLPSGRKSYVLRYRTRKGRRNRYLTLGPHGVLTAEQARKMARVRLAAVLDGADPAAERRRKAGGLTTVNNLVDRWIEDYAKIHRRRWKDDEQRLYRHVKPTLGHVHVEDLTPGRVAKWHREIGEEGRVSANRALSTLKTAWRWADAQGLLPAGLSDPTVHAKPFREKSRDRWLKREEIASLMEAVRKEEDPYLRAVFRLLLLTGLRKGEVLRLRWESVDLDCGEVRLPETKTGVPQVRLLPGPAVAILRQLPRQHRSPWVFPSPVNPSKPRGDLQAPWERIREAAGLQNVTLHDLRRSAGSHMAQAGVPLHTIGEILGHAGPEVTRIYARLASENERDALETLAQSLSGVLGGSGEPPGGKKREPLSDRLKTIAANAEEDPEAALESLRALIERRETKP